MAKIILTQEVSGLGAAGDVVTVKDGYARNYLLPRGFAVTWTQGGEKQVESIRAARAARAKASLEEAQAIAAVGDELAQKCDVLVVDNGDVSSLEGVLLGFGLTDFSLSHRGAP